jgi:hypothetical protein
MPLLANYAEEEGHAHLAQALAKLAVPVRTVESLFERDAVQLAKEAGLPRAHVEAFRLHVALLCAPRPSCDRLPSWEAAGGGATPLRSPFDTAASMFAALTAPLRTGSSRLDALLGGGICTHEVTEVVGRSGSGKTQLCFTLAVIAAEAECDVVYIDTANGFSPSRVMEIMRQRSLDLDAASLTALLSRIRVVRTFCIFEAVDVLGSIATFVDDSRQLGEPAPLQLVILDAVTPLVAPFLGGGDLRAYDRGQALVGHLAASLHRLAALRVGVVVANEARGEDAATNSSGASGSGAANSGGRGDAPAQPKEPGPVKSALGRSWGYAASARVTLRAAPHRPTPHGAPLPPAATRAVLATVAKHPRVMANTAAPVASAGGCTAEIYIGPVGVH